MLGFAPTHQGPHARRKPAEISDAKDSSVLDHQRLQIHGLPHLMQKIHKVLPQHGARFVLLIFHGSAIKEAEARTCPSG